MLLVKINTYIHVHNVINYYLAYNFVRDEVSTSVLVLIPVIIGSIESINIRY